MHKTLFAACAIAAAVGLARPAGAQTPGADAKWYGSVEAGASAVQNVGGLGGAQIGRHLSSRADVFAEALYLQDVATRRRAEAVSAVAGYLALSRGRAASATIDIPTWFAGGGIRYFLGSGASIRPYVIGQAGVARVALRPAFSLGGADVTSSLEQYGVTLGSDLTGTATRPAFGGGLGVVVGTGAWYLDAGLRVISVQFESQAANSKGVTIGIGRRF